MKSLLRASLAPIVVASALLSTTRAQAQTTHLSSTDWRRLDRSDSLGKSSSTQQFTFELRFGQYFPEVDSKLGLAKNSSGKLPYEAVFGGNDQFYFGLELDYLPFRIPYLGALGAGFGWGYTHASATANTTGTKDPSPTKTSFSVMPMHLSAVLRFDEIMRRTGFPVVPYGKIGLGLGLWTASPVPTDYTGTGGTWGSHLAVGGMLALNFLDPRAAARLDETTGVNHAYLFGELMRANLNGLGATPSFYVGSTSWVVGLAVDM